MTSTPSSLKDRVAELKSKKEARPFDDTVQLKGNRRLLFLTSIIQKFAKPGTPAELAKLVAEEICHHLKADQVSLLVQDTTGVLRVWSQFDRLRLPNQRDVSQSICESIMAGESVLIPEALSHPYFQTKESIMALNLRSVMACPIASINSQAPVGVLYVCSFTTGELFKPEDMDTLRAIAVVVGINLDRTQLLAQKDRLLKEQKAVAASRGRVVEVASHELGTPAHQIWTAIAVCQKQLEQMKARMTHDQPVTLTEIEALESMLAEAHNGFEALKRRFIEPLRKFNGLDLMIDQMSTTVISDEGIEAMLVKWHRMADQHHLRVFQALPVSLKGDPTLLDIALTHLVDNALKYSPAGSTVTITADQVEDNLVITITDKGIGIPAEDLPMICDWLVRGRNVVNIATVPSGMGIGLHTACRIIEAHGGELQITSELGKGTQVAIALPVFINSVQ